MRVIVQRVTSASVTVNDDLVSSIGRGLCVLVGISRDDTPKDRDYIARKLLNLRLFDDEKEDKRWDRSVKDKRFEMLCVSQFTLYSILKGNKPDFHSAMAGDQSKQFYDGFLDILRKDYEPELIKDGQFGAMMQVHIQNDGPVTITLESPVERGKQQATRLPLTPISKISTKKCGVPVAVVKAQQDKVCVKASRYVTNLAEEFQSPTIQKFKTTLINYRVGQISIAGMMYQVGTMLTGHRQLLCSFTGLLPAGHSLSIVNYDANQVRVHILGQKVMSLEEVKQYLEETQDTETGSLLSSEDSEDPGGRDMSVVDEVISQLEKLSTCT